jgi:hypothetical protein
VYTGDSSPRGNAQRDLLTLAGLEKHLHIYGGKNRPFSAFVPPSKLDIPCGIYFKSTPAVRLEPHARF